MNSYRNLADESDTVPGLDHDGVVPVGDEGGRARPATWQAARVRVANHLHLEGKVGAWVLLNYSHYYLLPYIES